MNLKEMLNSYERYGDGIEVNNELLNNDISESINRFLFILGQVSIQGDFNNYPKSKNDLVKDLTEIIINKHKDIFGDWEE